LYTAVRTRSNNDYDDVHFIFYVSKDRRYPRNRAQRPGAHWYCTSETRVHAWANLNWARDYVFVVDSALKILGNKVGGLYLNLLLGEGGGVSNFFFNLGSKFTSKIVGNIYIS
jgi:hypothetical protein